MFLGGFVIPRLAEKEETEDVNGLEGERSSSDMGNNWGHLHVWRKSHPKCTVQVTKTTERYELTVNSFI